jgi:hypothetical protein
MTLRQTFEGHVATIMRVRGLPRSEAEQLSFENTLIDHLNATRPDPLSDRCAYCGRPSESLLPIGVGERHTWLHQACWEQWRADRRAKAIAELAEAGVTARGLTKETTR